MSLQPQPLSIQLSKIVAAIVLSLSASLVHSENFKNFLDIEFITVPSGSFKMGSPTSSDVAYTNEFPQHQVTVTSFPISKMEVTLEQYKKYIIATNQLDIVTNGFMSANSHGDNAPVVHVSWNDAQGFIQWLNKTKPETDQSTYRLPGEAEWEYACSAGEDYKYCGSNTPSPVAWHSAISSSQQHAVGGKKANNYGLYDMSGNVLEWVEDCYHETYEGAPTDGTAWTTPCKAKTRVLRGGSWKDSFRKVRVKIRKNAPSVERKDTVGFRLVRQL